MGIIQTNVEFKEINNNKKGQISRQLDMAIKFGIRFRR